MPCTDKSRNTKRGKIKNELVFLAFFSVVASYSNLSTFKFGAKIHLFLEIRIG